MTPIDRARADLSRMQQELNRAQLQVQSLDVRIRKVEAYIEMAAVYETYDPQGEAGRARSVGGVVATSTQIAREILKEHGQPLHTRQILKMLEDRGVQVGGKDPVANLSGFLSRDNGFINSRAVGWGLSEWDQKNDVASTLPNAVVEPSPEPAFALQGADQTSRDAPWDAENSSELDEEIPF